MECDAASVVAKDVEERNDAQASDAAKAKHGEVIVDAVSDAARHESVVAKRGEGTDAAKGDAAKSDAAAKSSELRSPKGDVAVSGEVRRDERQAPCPPPSQGEGTGVEAKTDAARSQHVGDEERRQPEESGCANGERVLKTAGAVDAPGWRSPGVAGRPGAQRRGCHPPARRR